MIAFVTCIKHPDNAKSYAEVGALLEVTLSSICRQTDDDFVVIVVHNEKPCSFSDERVRFVQVAFDAPGRHRFGHAEYGAHLFDKGTKRAIGIASVQPDNPSHIMFFDGDDLLHHGLAAWANERPTHPGWYSPLGYSHTVGYRTINRIDDGFHKLNGSTSMIRTDLTGVPRDLPLTADQDEIARLVGEQIVCLQIGGHGEWSEHTHRFGETLESLPFASAVWEIGHGENYSRNLVSGRPSVDITEEITTQYGLQPTNRLTDAAARGRMLVARTRRKLS